MIRWHQPLAGWVWGYDSSGDGLRLIKGTLDLGWLYDRTILFYFNSGAVLYTILESTKINFRVGEGKEI